MLEIALQDLEFRRELSRLYNIQMDNILETEDISDAVISRLVNYYKIDIEIINDRPHNLKAI